MSRQSHTETWPGCKTFKLEEGRFRLDIRKLSFTMRLVEPWNRVAQR